MNQRKFIIASLFAILLMACNSSTKNTASDTSSMQQSQESKDSVPAPVEKETYSNQRFRDVTVEKIAENRYTISGEAQIFEANFNWVVEDGHDEIKTGYHMTDAGAPEWGNFKFTIEVEKRGPNSSLTLVLFEISAKDGSRQHELTIPLQ